MSFISISPSALPGEAAIVALCNLIQELAKDQTPEQKQLLWDRYIQLSAPFQEINVAIAQNLAQFLEKVLHITVKPT